MRWKFSRRETVNSPSMKSISSAIFSGFQSHQPWPLPGTSRAKSDERTSPTEAARVRTGSAMAALSLRHVT